MTSNSGRGPPSAPSTACRSTSAPAAYCTVLGVSDPALPGRPVETGAVARLDVLDVTH
ncbi:hypothetical protein ABZ479_20530 [Streptomyces sp. NPDC005722]